jgi:hypothetical protein
MALVSEKIYSRWFEKNHWMYRQFSYLFDNPIWKRDVPACFSLCPYFWLSLVSFVLLRCLMVPLYVAARYPIRILVRAFPIIASVAERLLYRLYKRLPDCWLKDSLDSNIGRFDDEAAIDEAAIVMKCFLSIALAAFVVYLALGFFSFLLPHIIDKCMLPISTRTEVASNLALCLVSISGLYALLRLPMKVIDTKYVSKTVMIMTFFPLLLSLASAVITLIYTLAATVWCLMIPWLLWTAAPAIWTFIVRMVEMLFFALGTDADYRLPNWIPFLFGIIFTSLSIGIFKLWSAWRAWKRRQVTSYYDSHPIEEEKVIALMVETILRDKTLSDRLYASSRSALPDKDWTYRTLVVRKIVESAIRPEYQRFHPHMQHVRWLGEEKFTKFQSAVLDRQDSFMSYVQHLDSWRFDDGEIRNPVEANIRKMAKKGMLKAMRKIADELPEIPKEAQAAPVRQDELILRILWSFLLVMRPVEIVVELAAKGIDLLVDRVLPPVFRKIWEAIVFFCEVASYTVDVLKAMKAKACPIIWFK